MAGGREAEFEEVFRREFPRVFRLAFLMVGNESEANDVTQEAMTRLFLHWRRLREYEYVGAWLRRVALREALRVVRRRRDAPFERDAAELDPSVRLDVHAAVLHLPGMQRACVALYYLEDRPVSEIADVLGASPATIRVHLHRARERLAQLLNDEDEDVAR